MRRAALRANEAEEEAEAAAAAEAGGGDGEGDEAAFVVALKAAGEAQQGGVALQVGSYAYCLLWRCLLWLCALRTTHYALLTTHYSLPTTHHSPLTTHYCVLLRGTDQPGYLRLRRAAPVRAAARPHAGRRAARGLN